MPFRLEDGPETLNPALVVLKGWGCRISIDVSDDEEPSLWRAELDDALFEAGNPLTLLAIVTLWRERGENWTRKTDPDLYDEVFEAAYSKRE